MLNRQAFKLTGLIHFYFISIIFFIFLHYNNENLGEKIYLIVTQINEPVTDPKIGVFKQNMCI